MADLNIFMALLAFFGGVALSANVKNRSAIIFAVGLSGNVALLLCLAVVIATVSSNLCLEFQQHCEISSFFSEKLSFPASKESFRTNAFIASGGFGAFSIYLLLALAFAKKRTFTVLAYAGAIGLTVGGAWSLFQLTIAPQPLG